MRRLQYVLLYAEFQHTTFKNRVTRQRSSQEGTGSERYLPSPIARLTVLIAIISVASLAVGHSRECSSTTADHLNNKTLILVVMTKAAPLRKTTRWFARALSWSAKIQSTELGFC